MARLSESEVKRLLQALPELYAARTESAFIAQLFRTLPDVIRADRISYNELDAKTGRMRYVWPDELASLGERLVPIFRRFIKDHPTAAYIQATGWTRALTWSDLTTRSKFTRTRLYQEFYRQLDTNYQLAIVVEVTPQQIVPIAFNRARTDFSETDRQLADLLQPHLIQAWCNAKTMTALEHQRLSLHQYVDGLDRGIVELTPSLRVRWGTPRALTWIKAYWGEEVACDRLPARLEAWVRVQENKVKGTGDASKPIEPLVVLQDHRELTVRFTKDGDRTALVFEERRRSVPLEALAELGLRPRERDVLKWLATGKTNAEIGAILSISPRTVQKHLERIYPKLGVETRTAAAARLLGLRH